MDSETWFYVIALGVTSVLLFTFLYAAVNEDGYTLKVIPSKYIYYFAAILIAILAFFLYIYIFYRPSEDHTGTQINAYYIITLVGIFLISWVFFGFHPTALQSIGMLTIVVGLILLTFF